MDHNHKSCSLYSNRIIFYRRKCSKKHQKAIGKRHFVRVPSIRAGKWVGVGQWERLHSKGVLQSDQWVERSIHSCALVAIHRIIDIARQCGLGRCRDRTRMSVKYILFSKKKWRSASEITSETNILVYSVCVYKL